jgi:hypothetical protein
MSAIKICKRCSLEKECPYNKRYCRDCQNLFSKEYKLKNKEKIAEYNKNYKSERKDEIKEYNKNYNLNNRESIQKRQTENQRNRRNNDINYKLSVNLRNRIKKFLKGETKSNKLIGCSIDFFKKWLEYNFTSNMNFDNYGSVWHMDHVIPCSLFNLENDNEKNYCFNWTNIRPYDSIKNMSRGNRLTIIDLLHQELKLKLFLKKYSENNLIIPIYNKINYL